jgi:hypothetical protein
MADRDPDQPGRRRLLQGLAGGALRGVAAPSRDVVLRYRRLAAALAALLAMAACSPRGEPQLTVSELNWACSTARCTVSFRLAAVENEAVVALVRAYDGDSVEERAIVGEYREMVTLGAGQSRRITASVDTERPANRVRVIVQRAR